MGHDAPAPCASLYIPSGSLSTVAVPGSRARSRSVVPTMVVYPGWNAPGQQQAPGWAVLSPVGVGRQPWPW